MNRREIETLLDDPDQDVDTPELRTFKGRPERKSRPDTSRSCPHHKIGYRTDAIAKSFAAQAGKYGKCLTIYKCPHCKQYHLTHHLK